MACSSGPKRVTCDGIMKNNGDSFVFLGKIRRMERPGRREPRSRGSTFLLWRGWTRRSSGDAPSLVVRWIAGAVQHMLQLMASGTSLSLGPSALSRMKPT